MAEQETFRDLIRRVREGDERAAAAVVRSYEPEIRRAVRVRLTDRRFRRVIDSMDICQSVLGSFFVRASLGQYELKEPKDLLRLLVSMTRNKVTDWARKETAQRRDMRRDRALGEAGQEPPARAASPSAEVAARDLLSAFQERLSEEERQIAERRAAGAEWSEIGKELGKSPEALRKQLARAVDRVAGELGLEEFARERRRKT